MTKGRGLAGMAATAPHPSAARPRLQDETPGRRSKREGYEARVAFLQQEARSEGFDLSAASRRDFESVALGAREVRRAELVLLPSGNLRAFWEDKKGTQLGLQFMGEDVVQYVLLRRGEGAKSPRHAVGRVSLERLEQRLTELGLRSLLYG